MSISPTPLPPGARTPREIIDYITSPLYANDVDLNTQIAALSALVAQIPIHTRDPVMPDSAKIGDTWTDPNTEQLKECNTAYLSGTGQASYWSAIRDISTLTIANNAVSGLDGKLEYEEGTSWPSDFTKGWIFKDTDDGTQYIANQTYVGAGQASYFDVFQDPTARSETISLQEQLDEISDDGVISPAEKLVSQVSWNRIVRDKAELDNSATNLGLTGSSEYTDYVAKHDALELYLYTTLDLFSDMANATLLTDYGSNRTEWDNKWDEYYDYKYRYDVKVSYFNSGKADDIADDGYIYPDEARNIRVRWDEQTRRRNEYESLGTTLGITAESIYTDFMDAGTGAYDVMDTLLRTTLDIYGSPTYPIDISGLTPDWETRWDSYYTAERSLNKRFSTKINERIDSLGDDGVISAGQEKRFANQEWKNIRDYRYPKYLDQGNNALILASDTGQDVGAKTVLLTTNYNALNTYLNSTLVDFDDVTVSTTVDDTEWDTAWNNYYTAESNLVEAIDSVVQNRALVGMDFSMVVDAMALDLVISVEEKAIAKSYWDVITGPDPLANAGDGDGEFYNMKTQATSLSVTASIITELQEAYNDDPSSNDLYYLLETELALFDNMAVSTDLTPAQGDKWVSHWKRYNNALANITHYIISKLGTAATSGLGAKLTIATPETLGGNLPMGGNKVTGMANGTITSGGLEAVNGGQLYSHQNATGTSVHGLGTMSTENIASISTNIGMNSKKITSLGNGVAGTDAANVNNVNNAISTHLGVSNPHSITKSTVGLGNVNNVAALPLTGGTVTGNIDVNGANDRYVQIGDGTYVRPALILNVSAGAASGDGGFLDARVGGVSYAKMRLKSDHWVVEVNNATDAFELEGKKIIELGDPSSAQDAATKNYVDNHNDATVVSDEQTGTPWYISLIITDSFASTAETMFSGYLHRDWITAHIQMYKPRGSTNWSYIVNWWACADSHLGDGNGVSGVWSGSSTLSLSWSGHSTNGDTDNLDIEISQPVGNTLRFKKLNDFTGGASNEDIIGGMMWSK